MAAKGDVRSIVKALKKRGDLEVLGIDEDFAAECIELASMSPEEFEDRVLEECDAIENECEERHERPSGLAREAH